MEQLTHFHATPEQFLCRHRNLSGINYNIDIQKSGTLILLKPHGFGTCSGAGANLLKSVKGFVSRADSVVWFEKLDITKVVYFQDFSGAVVLRLQNRRFRS